MDLGSRVPGRLLQPRVRKVLVWVHLAGINAIAIGEQGLVCFGAAAIRGALLLAPTAP